MIILLVNKFIFTRKASREVNSPPGESIDINICRAAISHQRY
jgi:hypothetical protein